MKFFTTSEHLKKAGFAVGILAGAIFLVQECGVSSRFVAKTDNTLINMGAVGTGIELAQPKDELTSVAPTQEVVAEPFNEVKDELSGKGKGKAKRKRIASGKPMGTTTELEAISTEPNKLSDLQIGVDLTSGFVAPTLRYEIAVSDAVALGAHFSYSRNIFSGPEATLYGGGLSVSYFPLKRALYGLALDGQLSLYDVVATTIYRRSHITPLAATAGVSWHGELLRSVGFVAGAGLQYVHLWGQDSGDIIYHSWVPAFRFGIGYHF